MSDKDLIDAIRPIIIAAGDAILEVRKSADFNVEIKSDSSPVTRADNAAHRVIFNDLQSLTPDIPVISEEGVIKSDQEIKSYWLVDPLDGTKEFIKGRDQFTVNIGLIRNNKAALGLLLVPATGELYFGGPGFGAFRETRSEDPKPIHVSDRKIAKKVVASLSHMDEGTREYLSALPQHETIQAGSALKIVRVAEGEADLYPRFSPLMQWDIAAGHAILEGAGGRFLDPKTDKEIEYVLGDDLRFYEMVCDNGYVYSGR